jgi:hypothetical protein
VPTPAPRVAVSLRSRRWSAFEALVVHVVTTRPFIADVNATATLACWADFAAEMDSAPSLQPLPGLWYCYHDKRCPTIQFSCQASCGCGMVYDMDLSPHTEGTPRNLCRDCQVFGDLA